MKLETLVTRYKNMGYEPRGLERDLEVASIIKWLYEKHDIYVYALYCSMRFPEHKKFKGTYIYNCKEDYHNSFHCEKSFDSPLDALFDAVRHMYSSFHFQYKYSSDKK